VLLPPAAARCPGLGSDLASVDNRRQRRYHPRMKSGLRRFLDATLLALTCMGLLLTLTREWPDRSTEEFRYSSLIRNRRFDFIRWELDALGSKLLYSFAPAHTFLDEDLQRLVVGRFFDQLQQVQSLEAQIASAYADPAVTNPLLAVADLDRQLKGARGALVSIQPTAEGVIEEQIAAVLADQGITAGGRTFPPVKLRFTALPVMLVISPRDRIEAIHFFPLEHGIDMPARVELEAEIDRKLNVSSLISNIGGLAAYPAMMLESSSPNWVIETGAHEWTHHYLTLHPLGVLYDTDPQLRTMNETVAGIVGKEIGQQVVARYYPEWTPPPDRGDTADITEPSAFDFRAQMHITRVHVDELLAQGQIEQAEAYMEERRRLFWENGYQIRKLNQAYFAFHGAYADEPGAPGADPVGPAVLALRDRSASLKEFLETVAQLTDFSELEQMLR
jgi:hypothetical protein